MKILLLTKIFPPRLGGIPNYYWNLVFNLKEVNVVVLTGALPDSNGYDDLMRHKGVEVVRVKIFPPMYGIEISLKWFWAVVRMVLCIIKLIVLKKIDYIVVGQPEFFQSLVSFVASRIARVPYIIFLHNEEIPDLIFKSNFFLRFLFKNSYAQFCNSSFTAQKFSCFMGVDVYPIIVTPGVEEKFFGKRNGAVLRKKLNLENKKVLYTIARLDERKGHDFVLKSLPQVISKIPDVVYIIGGEGPYTKVLVNLVKEEKLEDYVLFLGKIPQESIVEYHSIGDVFIMPNRKLAGGDTEGFGIVFLEANAVGKPVIGGRSGGAVDAIVDGVTGFLVDPENPAEIAKKIIWLFEHPLESRLMGDNGRERCFRNFRWKDLSHQFETSLINVTRGHY